MTNVNTDLINKKQPQVIEVAFVGKVVIRFNGVRGVDPGAPPCVRAISFFARYRANPKNPANEAISCGALSLIVWAFC